MWPYDREIEPPAPFLEILLYPPGHPDMQRGIRAKLDTGADISAIPESLVEALNLQPESLVLIEGYDLKKVTLPTYHVGMVVAQVSFQHQEVIAFPETYVLLGRDVLNHFYVHLNGPELTFDLGLTA